MSKKKDKIEEPKVLQKRFIVRKFIYANSVEEACRKEKEFNVDDCWVDEDWKKENKESSKGEMGFRP